MNKTFLLSFVTSTLLATGAFFTSCSDNTDPTNGGNEIVSGKGQFFISVKGSSSEYIMQAPSIESGELNINNNVFELPSTDYAWIFRNNLAIGMAYQQQNPGLGYGVELQPDTTLKKIREFNIAARFTNYGFFENYLITSVSGQEIEGKNDGANFIFWDIDKGLASVKDTTLHTEPIAANGEQITFSGIVDTGNGEFLTSMVESGFNQTGTGMGNSVGTVKYPDSIWVAAFDKNMHIKRIYRDDRISYSAAMFRSQVFSQMGIADDGTTYVFSGAFDNNTKHPAGALRIKKGATEFDKDYYFDIEKAADGYQFRRVWHLTGSKFILEIYRDKGVRDLMIIPTTQFAIVDMDSKNFTWVTGIPDRNKIVSGGTSGSIPLYHNGKVYIPITESGQQPAIYIADITTGEAHKGAVIKGATEIRALGFLTLK